MKILVTGGSGFIGSHTVVELLAKGHEVVIVDNFCNSKQYVIDRIEQITGIRPVIYNCDITDYKSMDRVFTNEHPECIIHFAALKSGADSIKNPGLYYHNNIDGTFVIVSLMEKYDVKRIVFSSSATVYGNNENVPIKETEPIGNVISPYGMTKYLCELYLKNKSEQSRNFKTIALRYFNPIGAHPSGLIGEDSPDAIPNNLMLYVLKVAKKELPYLNVFGNDYKTKDGSGLRDYIHVVDLANGHVAAVDYFDKMEDQFDVFNLGTGNGHTVIELVNTFERVNGIEIPYKFAPRRPGDVSVSFAAVEKANKTLNWVAKYNLDDCLRDAWNFSKRL